VIRASVNDNLGFVHDFKRLPLSFVRSVRFDAMRFADPPIRYLRLCLVWVYLRPFRFDITGNFDPTPLRLLYR
jgi:hypothetical protein